MFTEGVPAEFNRQCPNEAFHEIKFAGAHLLTWMNIDPSMDKYLLPL